MLILTTGWENVNNRCHFRTNAGAADGGGVIKAVGDRLLSYSSQMERELSPRLVPGLGFCRFAAESISGSFMVQ
jgi:hypothetical protein